MREDYLWIGAFWIIIIQLIFLEGILSIDNAAVLGALVAPLPTTLRVPWPHYPDRPWDGCSIHYWDRNTGRPCGWACWALPWAAA